MSITISIVTTNSIQSCILTRKLFFQMACVGYFQLFSWTIVYLSIAAKNLSTQAFKQCSIHKRLPLPLLCLKVKHRPFTFSTSPQALYLPHCLLELYSQSITSRNDDDRVECCVQYWQHSSEHWCACFDVEIIIRCEINM